MRTLQMLCLMQVFFFFNCKNVETEIVNSRDLKQYITVLGIAQDAGYPQIDCEKSCCSAFYNGEESKKMVSCLGLVDVEANKKWLFDATPDMPEQIQMLKTKHLDNNKVIDGIFLTHAHIGHYTGLMHLGFEALGGDNIPVYAMPRMKHFLETNGPWSQLVSFNNIDLRLLRNDSAVTVSHSLKVIPLQVPHRDEFSETVGYKVIGPNKSALFIPDIDKWHLWRDDIVAQVKRVDYAFVDASFFRDGELKRDMSKIPHPFTTETTSLFQNESLETKNKIYFIHFNHTNPTIKDRHPLKDSIQNLGFNFAKEGAVFQM